VIIFATIFGVGFVLLILNLLFGHDADADADMGDVSADADHGFHGPNILSFKVVALFMVGFGAVGFGVRATTDHGMFTASMAGLGGALIVAAIGYVVIRAFWVSQASSTITDSDIIGQSGTLTDGIGVGAVGQVACVVRGREITFLARSRTNTEIKRGAVVRIVSKAGNTVTVEPTE